MNRDQRRILCDKHCAPMKPVKLQYGNISFEQVAYKCAETLCGTHYTDARGYFDLIGGPPRDRKSQRCCLTCGSPLYLSEIQGSQETWRCPLPECNRQRLAS